METVLLVIEPPGTSGSSRIIDLLRATDLPTGVPILIVNDNQSDSNISKLISMAGAELVAILEPREKVFPTLGDLADLYIPEVLDEMEFPLLGKSCGTNPNIALGLLYGVCIADSLQKRNQSADNLVRGPPKDHQTETET